ncbi:hypothetical protein [Kineococcus glutinatus]|uniref:hypothetical protein n=1 Tax=Kineococcus glutinatus TaxID=1070872 RepID=UPI0031F0C390
MEWAALSGDEVETVLSNLFYNWNNRALRIRPAQGDFGLDIIIPTDGHTIVGKDAQWDVYQVKKFASNLTDGQKGQIEKSFGRVLIGLVRRGFPMRDWYLVAPLDPTLPNLQDWFAQLPELAFEKLAKDTKAKVTDAEFASMRAWLEAPGRKVEWKGLGFCESLASEFPYVVDYYLHGGRERLRDAVAAVAQLLQVGKVPTQGGGTVVDSPGAGSAALLEPAEIRQYLQQLSELLDTDPHFRYGYSVDLHRPQLAPEPGLIAATQESVPGPRWLTFKIYQRSAQSLEERPIPLELEFDFEGSPDDQAALELWSKYGKPAEVAASIKVDFPGGLSGGPSVGKIQLSAAEGSETKTRNRLRIVDAAGEVLAELNMNQATTAGLDGTGTWTRGVDDSGLLESEALIDLTSLSGQINFTLHPLEGREASKALAALTFAAHLQAPNNLQVAGEYGPFMDFTPIKASEPPALPALLRFVGALAIIQHAIATPVLIPDASALTPTERDAIRRAASLIGGQTIVGHWESLNFEKHPEADLSATGHYQLAIREPLVAPINGAPMILGTMIQVALSAKIEVMSGDRMRATPRLNNVTHTTYSPDMPISGFGQKAVACRKLPDSAISPDAADSE